MVNMEMNSADFGSLLDQHLNRLKTTFKVGDKVSGVVTAIDSNAVFVDVNLKNEAIIDRVELLDDQGQLTVKVGDKVEAICVSFEDGDVRLSKKMGAALAGESALQDAQQAGVPVEGKVTGEIKGGYEVMVGTTRGFCPYSQIDIGKQDANTYIGQKYLFKIQQYSEGGRQLVLNRRRLLEAERELQRQELKERLKVGDIVPGRVSRLMPFGVFVDIGSGVDGLVPLSELGWKRGIKPEDVVKTGDEVTVMVRELDWDRNRISLSLKFALGDPWSGVENKYLAGTEHKGVVSQLMPFGAFVELEPGIDGLIPISRLGAGRRIKDPGEVVSLGEPVEVTVENLDLEQRRISLSLVVKAGLAPVEPVPAEAPVAAAPPEPGAPPALAGVGAEVTGVVEALKEFGAFIKLADGRKGLLHISQMGLPDSPTRTRMMRYQYAEGREVSVVIREINGDRISLTLRATLEKEKENEPVDLSQFKHNAGGPELGSLGAIVDFSKLTLGGTETDGNPQSTGSK